MASVPYVGSRISLISKAQIRYEGMLYSVNREDATIALSKVQSFGTEGRPAEHHVPTRSEIYEFIIFKADDIAELTVCEPPAQFQDPAIVSMGREQKPPTTQPAPIGSKPVQYTNSNVPAQPAQQQSAPQPAPVAPQPPSSYRNAAAAGVPGRQATQPPAPQQQQQYHNQQYNNQQYGNNAYGGRDARGYHNGYQQRGARGGQYQQWNGPAYHQSQQQQYGQQRGRGGAPAAAAQTTAQRGVAPPRRGGPSNTAATRPAAGEKLKFDTDFDWTATNAQFESELKAITEVLDKKVKVSTRAHQPEDDNDDEVEDLDAVSTGKGTGAPPPQDENACYDKTKSFFDKISCEALEREEGSNTRPDWNKERETNTQTFGQASVRHNHYFRGGRGGPGAGGYRGGRGGYNRRY